MIERCWKSCGIFCDILCDRIIFGYNFSVGIQSFSPDGTANLDVGRFAADANLHEFRGIDFSRIISEQTIFAFSFLNSIRCSGLESGSLLDCHFMEVRISVVFLF